MPKIPWTRCDEFNHPVFLNGNDWCAFHEQYFEGRYDSSPGNQLVFNFKTPIEFRSNQSRWHFKGTAIQQYAQLLIDTAFTEGTALVPAPTSKTRSSPDYDDRLDQVGRRFMIRRPEIPVYHALEATHDHTPYHVDAHAARRPDILRETMRLVPEVSLAHIRRVYIFDDLITTGGHFVAAKELLRQAYPHIEVRGLFLAMRMFSPPPERSK